LFDRKQHQNVGAEVDQRFDVERRAAEPKYREGQPGRINILKSCGQFAGALPVAMPYFCHPGLHPLRFRGVVAEKP